MSDTHANTRFGSQEWFDNPNNPGMTALYLERCQNSTCTREERTRDKPIIGIAQTGSDLAPRQQDSRLKAGINHMPTVGDGRQSGTSESPSILNASPEAAVGGGLALLRTGDRVPLDLNARTLNALVDEAEWAERRAGWTPPDLADQTPWQEICRREAGQLAQGGCPELATACRRVAQSLPRDNH